LAGDHERTLEIVFCIRCTSLGRLPRDFSGNAIDLSLPPPFLRCFYVGDRFLDAPPSIIKLAKVRIGLRQMLLYFFGGSFR
jgi:hypothetical protein